MSNKQILSLGGEGILVEPDLIAFSKAENAIIALMADGEFYKADEIIEASGQREGLRRLRKLRDKGFVVERMRSPHLRDFLYRLTPVID